jgi:hypothetical protein
LRKDDRIVEVNGIDVRDKSNREIAKIIKENENNLVIGVLKSNDTQQEEAPHVHTDSNLKSIVGEALQTSRDYQTQPVPAVQQQPTGSMTNIRSIIADVTRMHAPDTVQINPGVLDAQTIQVSQAEGKKLTGLLCYIVVIAFLI